MCQRVGDGSAILLETTIAVSSFVSSPNLLFEETAGRLLPVSIISTRPVVSSPIKRESPLIAGGRPFIAFQRHHPYHRRVAYTYALSLRSSSENTRGSIARSSCQLSFARFFTFSLSPYIGSSPKYSKNIEMLAARLSPRAAVQYRSPGLIII